MLLYKAHQAQGRRLSLYNASMLLVALAAVAAPAVVAVFAIERGYAWQVVGGLMLLSGGFATGGFLFGAAKINETTARIVEVRCNSQALRLIGSLNRQQAERAEVAEAAVSAATTSEAARAEARATDGDSLRLESPGKVARSERNG